MTFNKKQLCILSLLIFFILFATGCIAAKTSLQKVETTEQQPSHLVGNGLVQQQDKKGEKQAQQIFDQFIEKLRWSRYWQGITEYEDIYVEGKQISTLFFWSEANLRPKWGVCISELGLCVANHANPDWPGVATMRFERGLTSQLGFASFGNTNYGDGPYWPKLREMDFEFLEKNVVLPPLGLPSSILRRVVPKEAFREAEKVKRDYVCWTPDSQRPTGCTGTLVFSYYNEADQYWHVLRTCSNACPPSTRGDSIQLLTRRERREWGWFVTVGGHINTPAETVEGLKQKILKAEMFRLTIP